jgi:hypothetical protein
MPNQPAGLQPRMLTPMSAPDARSTPGDAGYIRGGGGVEVNTGRVVRFLVVTGALVLIALTVATAVSAANQNARATKLQNHGVPVDVTVTGCVGVSSGIAQAIQYYQCRGSYTLDGQQYNEVIGGVRSARPEGEIVHAVAAREDPALVSTVGSAKKGSYVVPIVLGALALVLILGLLLWPRRTRPSTTG